MNRKNNRQTYLSKLLKKYRNFWGKKSANPALSVPDAYVCTSCFEVEYWNRSRFKQFWAPLHAWFGTRTLWSGTWGGKINCSKNRDFAVLRAPCVFGARQVLRQPLVTYKTFGKNRFSRMFLICPKNALVTFGVCPLFAF